MSRALVRTSAESHRHAPRPSHAPPKRTRSRRDEILALHSKIGNRAVARLFENAAQSGDEVIQRKIGFELETGIPITIYTADGQFSDPNDVQSGWKQPVGGGHNLMADHSPGHERRDPGDFDEWPIVEFVSAPVEDNEDPGDFQDEAEDWIELLGRIRGLMNGTPAPNHLNDEVPAASDGKRIGYVDEQRKMGDRGPNSVSVQYTFGAKLSKLNQVFQQLGTVAEGTGGGKAIWEKADALKAASANVTPLMPKLTTNIKDYSNKLFDSKKTKKNKQQQFDTRVGGDLPDIKGYLELVSAYLIAGKTVSSRGFTKNRVTLFYKSKLSSVRNELVNQNPYAATIFTSSKNKSWLKKQLMKANDRAGNESVFLGNDRPKVGEWLDAIFAGTDDEVFLRAKNPWSDEIQPDTVGGDLAAVMEMRTPGTVFSANAAFDLVGRPEAVVHYLKQLYRANQQAQDL